MTIQAFFFDMGGTIETFWYTPELRQQATPELRHRLLSAGIDLPINNQQLFEIISTGLERYHRWSVETLDELSPQRVWREYILAGYAVDNDKLDAIAEDLMLYLETRYYHREMRPEIPAVLAEIHQMGLKIGLISNVCSRGQVPLNLAEYGIRQYFDPVVLSSEYGRRKPDPAIFHYAARLASVPTSACAYVGDRLSRDITGAQRAGYRLAIQIRHNFEHGEEDRGTDPDFVINQMTELLDILRTQIARRSDRAGLQETSSGGIRGILFDAGDILYYRPHQWRRLKQFLKELSIIVPEDPSSFRSALQHQAFQGQITRDHYQEAILELFGVTRPEDVERGKAILDEEDNNIQFFPGVRNTLLSLRKAGFLLGVVTDTALPVHVKLSWFERGGFGAVWDTIISSEEMGVRKPDPRMYHAALQQLGLPAGQVVFVGHKASELDGARAVGMKTIALNYEKTAQADFYIGKFPDLLKVPPILSGIRRSAPPAGKTRSTQKRLDMVPKRIDQ